MWIEETVLLAISLFHFLWSSYSIMVNSPFTMRDAARGVSRRKYRVAIVFLLILGAVGAVTLLAKKQYTSYSKIFVRLGRENVGLDPTATLGEGTIITNPISRESELNSVVHMIRSRDLLEEVVDHFGEACIMQGSYPSEASGDGGFEVPYLNELKEQLTEMGVLNDLSQRERAIIKLEKKVDVEVLDFSNVISVSFETGSPQLAKDVVDWMVDRYIERHVRIHRSDGAVDFMIRQSTAFLSQLQEKERKLEKFKMDSGMVSSDLLKQELVSSIADIKTRLRESRVECRALESEVRALRSGVELLPTTSLVTETRGAGNQGVDGMRQLLYEQELQLAEISEKYTPSHPLVQGLKTASDNSRKIMDAVEQQRTETVVGPNPVFDAIRVELLKKEPLFLAAKEKCDFLEADLKTEQARLAEFSQQERVYRALTRDLDLEEANYRQYVRNLAQVSVDQSLEDSRLSNISVSQPATLSEKPSRPNKLINLIVGFVLATFGSFGSAVLSAYFYDDQEYSSGEVTNSSAGQPEGRVANNATRPAEA